jgi:hypothetical protein
MCYSDLPYTAEGEVVECTRRHLASVALISCYLGTSIDVREHLYQT